MTIRELLDRLVKASEPKLDWINIKTPELPWKHIMHSADRGEVKVSKIGRTVLMRREDLDRWLSQRSIRPKTRTSSNPKRTKEETPQLDAVDKMLASKGLLTRVR